MPQKEQIDPSRTDASDAKLAAQVKDWAMRPRNYRGDPPLKADVTRDLTSSDTMFSQRKTMPPTKPVTKGRSLAGGKR